MKSARYFVVAVLFALFFPVISFASQSVLASGPEKSESNKKTDWLFCPLLLNEIKLGDEGGSVLLLQRFLIETENMDIPQNGIFDEFTFEAVKSFQKKYLSEIMTPWGATGTSGKVSITTINKINEIACKKEIPLLKWQLQAIENYKSQGGQVITDISGNKISVEGLNIESIVATSGDSQKAVSSDSVSQGFIKNIWKGIKKFIARGKVVPKSK